MKPTNLRRYLAHIKETGHYPIDERALEKDLMLSTFLSEMHGANELIFKGGTLLTKQHLGYHRISEDLDFTHTQSTFIRTLPRTQRERTIRELIKPLLDTIKATSARSGLEFSTDRTDERYVRVRNSRAIYELTLHYTSALDNRPSSIKLEINFVEDMIYPTETHDIPTIIDHTEADTEYLASIGYEPLRPTLVCYSIDEIIAEKLRALLTREEPKERDLFDLFLVNQRYAIRYDPHAVHRKIDAAHLTNPQTLTNLKESYARLKRNELVVMRDIDDLTLIPFDRTSYERFETDLIRTLHQICAAYEGLR